MTNPLFESLDDHMRGEHVRVVGNDGTTYEGWCERIHHHDRHILLRDAVNVDRGDDVGTAYVAHCDSIEVLETDSRIERVTIDDVEPAPYAAREFEREGNCQYIARVRGNGWAGSFPVVRCTADGYEVVEGHKRLWVAEQAGLTTHPVEVVDADDWELARRFVVDHLPDEEQVNEDGTARGCYDGEQIETAIARLIDRWGERAFELPRVSFNADRVGAGVNDDSDPTGTERRSADAGAEPEGEATDEDVEAAVDDHDELPEFDELLEPESADDGDEPALEAVCSKCGESHDDGPCWEEDDQPDEPELLGTYTVRDYGSPMLPLSGATYRHFDDADRVHVREREGRYELARGGRDEWPDYKVSEGSGQIALGAPAIDLLGVEEDDEVEVLAMGDDAVIVPPGEITAIPETEYSIGDPINEAATQDTEADGGVATDSPDALPSGVTPQDVRDAVETADGVQKTGHSYLGDIAEVLNVRKARARLFCHQAGVYDEVTDASGYRGGVD